MNGECSAAEADPEDVETVDPRWPPADPDPPAAAAPVGPDPVGPGPVGPGPVGPGPVGPGPVGPDPRRISWDTERVDPPAPVGPHGPGRRPGRRSAWIVIGGFALVAALVAGAVGWSGVAGPGGAELDLFAVDQVAQRYRALGVDVLAGARHCGPLAPAAGQTERVGCDFGTGDRSWSVELTSYDVATRLRAVRAKALAPAPDSARSATIVDTGAAFAMEQDMAGASRIYWDVESPRPVSATVRTGELSLRELVAFYDERRFAAVARPEQPGAAFSAPGLWQLASEVVENSDGDCAAVPPKAEYPGTVEQVTCRFAGGVRVDYGLVGGPESFHRLRPAWSAPPGIEPGTHWVGVWESPTRGLEFAGQLAFYSLAGDPTARGYYDRREWLSYGVLHGEGMTAEQLHEFWLG